MRGLCFLFVLLSCYGEKPYHRSDVRDKTSICVLYLGLVTCPDYHLPIYRVHCFREIIDSWLNHKFHFLSPNSSFLDTEKSIAASKLTCSEGADAHFKCSDIASLQHIPVEHVVSELKSLLNGRYIKLNPKVEKYATECRAQIVKRHMRFKGQELRNEAGVRYTYGDPIVDMLVDGHGYTMQFQETMNDNTTSISSRSRTDYACWNVYTLTGGSEEQVCVTVLETKHQPPTKDMSCYSQVIGYYCAKRQSSNRAGVAILLNEFRSNVTIDIFLFLYFSDDRHCYGVQSLKLPDITYKSSPYLSLGSIALIYLICWDGEDLLRLACPVGVIVLDDIIRVYTNEDLKDQQLRQKDEEIQRLRREKDQEIQQSRDRQKDEEIQRLRRQKDQEIQ